jgi:hypothetical protein
MIFVNGNAYSKEWIERCVDFERARSPFLDDEVLEKIVFTNLANDPEYYAEDDEDEEVIVEEIAELPLDFSALTFGEIEENEDGD